MTKNKESLRPAKGETAMAFAKRLAFRVRGIDSLPEKEIVKRLEELFYIVVDPYKTPDTGDWRYRDRLIVASQTLHAVGEVATRIRKFPSLSNLVSSNVGLLIPWIHYIYSAEIRNVTKTIRSNTDDKQKAISTLSGAIIAIFHTHPDYKEIHPEIKSNYDIISNLWLEEDIRNPVNVKSHASHILWLLLERTPDGHLDFVEALNATAGGNSDRVADIAISKLRQAMIEAANDPSILMHLTNAFMLSFGRNHGISHSMHEHQIFTTFSKCMRHLAQTMEDANDEFTYACSHYYRLLPEMILKDAEDATRAFRQCIRYGMLDGIAQLLILLHRGKNLNGSILSSLENIIVVLNAALMTAPVCVDISNAFNRLPVTVFSVRMHSSPEWKNWRQFVHGVMVNSVFLKFVAQAREKAVGVCFHCRNQFLKSSLRPCGRCKIVYYCSKACQEGDWKADHKNCCTLVVQHKTANVSCESEVSRKAREFVRFIALYDIRRHRPHLQHLLLRGHRIVIDYSHGYPLFRTFQDSDFNDKPYLLVDYFMQLTQKDTMMSSKHSVFVEVLYPNILGKNKSQNFILDNYEEGDETEYPRLRAGIEESEKRPGGRFADGDIPLWVCYDEVDEIVHRMKEEGKRFPDLMQDPLKLVDKVFDILEKDWSFKSQFQLRYSSFALAGTINPLN